MTKVSLLAVVAALVAVGCGVDPPTAAPTNLPAHGAPSTLELSASSGTGANGGHATVTARVLDAYALVLPDVSVTFGATAGTLSEATVATNGNGVATTTLTADPGTVKITAVAGGVSAPETQITIQPLNVFVPPPPGPPPPPEPPPPPTPPPPPLLPFYVVAVTAPTSVVAGVPATLTATVTPFNGAPPASSATWLWDCDTATLATDGATPNSVPCTYTTASTFNASVKVTGAGGSPTATATTTVTVTAAPAPVVPDITVSCGTVTRPGSTTCSVSAKLSGVTVAASRITSVVWDFGDGSPTAVSTTTTNTNTHTYLGAATYTVVVTDVVVTGTTAKGSGSGTALVQ
jgi:hypothetical protein